ncbi:hypothetical protein KIPB_009770, partial [Kipferlia bialata]
PRGSFLGSPLSHSVASGTIYNHSGTPGIIDDADSDHVVFVSTAETVVKYSHMRGLASSLEDGSTVMVVDCAPSTTDVSTIGVDIERVDREGEDGTDSLRQLHMKTATSRPCEPLVVADESLIPLMDGIFGATLRVAMTERCPEVVESLRSQWSCILTDIDRYPGMNPGDLHIRAFPSSLEADIARDTTLDEELRTRLLSIVGDSSGLTLRISLAMAKAAMDEALAPRVEAILDTMETHTWTVEGGDCTVLSTGVNTVLLTGEYASNKCVAEGVSNRFPDMSVVACPDQESAIVLGSLMWALDTMRE